MRFRYTLSSEYSGSLILSKDPKGWESMETVIKRGFQYHGTFYETMVQLQFNCGSGKEYIDNIYETYGVDAVINILIQINCSGGIGNVEANDYSDDYSDDYGSLVSGPGFPAYETFFEGTLDLSKYNKTTKYTYVDLLQSDFIQKTINRFKTKVNIDVNKDLDDNDLDQISNIPYNLTIPSKPIRYTSEQDFNEDAADTTVTGINFQDESIITPPVLDGVGDLLGAIAGGNYVNIVLVPDVDPYKLFTAEFTGTYTIIVDMAGTFILDSATGAEDIDASFRWGFKFGPDLSNPSIHPFIDSENATYWIPTVPSASYSEVGPTPITHNFDFTRTFTIDMEEGDLFIFFANIYDSSPNTTGSLRRIFTRSSVSYQIDTVTAPSTSKAYYIHETGAAIAQRITGLEDPFRSTLLGRTNSLPVSYDDNGCLSFAAITNGKKIRRYPVDKSNLFISMDDFFNCVNMLGNIGMGFEKVGDQYVIRMEEKEFFYSLTTLLQCPNANEIKTSVAKEYYVSDILIGYDKWENEETNGIDEFNTKREYNTGIKSIESRLALMNPIIASAYTIEFTRRKNYTNFPTLDWQYDDDNFILFLNRSVDGNNEPDNLDTVELDENYSQINNVLAPEDTYGYRGSPARSLLRHLNVINGSLIKYANRLIKFVYGEGNYFMESQFTNDVCTGNFDNELLSESQDINSTESGITPIWIPEYIEFEYPVSFADFLTIKNTPHACIEVSNTEADFVKGYIIEMRYKPVGGMASFKLLRAYEA